MVCTRSNLRFPLATGSPVGTSPFCFLVAPSYFTPVVLSGFFVGASLVFFFFLYQGFTLFLRLFAWICSAPFLLRDVVPSIFSSFSSRSTFLDFCFSLFCPLPFSVFFHGVLGDFLLCWGFSLPVLSPSPWSSQRMVPAGFILPVFVLALSFVLFFVSLVHPLHLACSDLGPFLRFSCLVRLYSFLFFYLSLHWVILVLFFGVFSSFSFRLCFGWCSSPLVLPVFRATSTSSLIPLPRSFSVPSVRGWGCSSVVFFLYASSCSSGSLIVSFGSFFPLSFFAVPPSVHSRPFFLYFLSGSSVFLYMVFLLGPTVALHFYIHIHDFYVTIPWFLFIGLVFFYFGAWLGSLLFQQGGGGVFGSLFLVVCCVWSHLVAVMPLVVSR